MINLSNSIILFDFDEKSKISSWQIVDDVVMGGRSNGNFSLSEEGHGVFSGEVSLENNGGFSSVRYRLDLEKVSPDGVIKIYLKGDEKDYQFRVKNDTRAYYSYIFPFQTSGEWEVIKIPLKEMYPSFRGRKLSGSNFTHNSIQEITFLIGNKKPQSFELLLDRIEIVN
ncbi:CIA30 family protein [Ekhidna sp.]